MLLVARQDGEALVRVVQVVDIVADDAGRARVDQRLDPGLLTRLNNAIGAVHVDLLEQVLGIGVIRSRGRCGVDDDVGLQLLEGGQKLLGVGDVDLLVDGARVAVLLAAQVDGRDGARGPLLEGLVDDVVAEEAVAADDEDATEVAALLFRHSFSD